MDAPVLRWGILGTGWIADKFTQALLSGTRQQVTAVGSRSAEVASSFAARFGIPGAHGCYEDLVSDPTVDIVYVASPHHVHVEHGLLAIEAGKHVLIEKPIALSATDLDLLLGAAASRGVLCQEALWTFFLPKFDVIRQVVDAGLLGDIVTVIADHGEWLPPDHRIHDPALAGGSLHDLGVYTFALSCWAVGRPDSVLATGRMTETGVIGDVAVAMRTRGGAVSSLSTTMMTTTPCRAVIAGTEALLTTEDAFFFPGPFTVTHHQTGQVLRWDEPNPRHGALHFEAAEVARRIHAGETSIPAWTATNARDVMATLDAVNAQLGLAQP